MSDLTIAEFAARLEAMREGAKHVKRDVLQFAGETVEHEAKSYPGSYQEGWPRLAESTIKRKATGDSPLLETGEMRDSIGHRVVDEDEVQIGSDNEKALWHEMGTSRAPPRPFLALALRNKTPDILKHMHERIGRLFVGRGFR